MNYNTEKIPLTRTCIDLIGSQYNVQLLDVCVSNHLSHATPIDPVVLRYCHAPVLR